MRHQPHLHLPGPWSGDRLEAPDATKGHLARVLRYPTDGPVSYTDGQGSIGDGIWTGSHVERGGERVIARPGRFVTLVVAPPKAKERQRFIVEKLQELGVAELRWWSSTRTQSKPPRIDRAVSWAVSALEQSRGAFLMSIGAASESDVSRAIVTDPGGIPSSELEWPEAVTLAVGPEGGLTDEERGAVQAALSLGPTVLRSESAAIAAAVLAMH